MSPEALLRLRRAAHAVFERQAADLAALRRKSARLAAEAARLRGVPLHMPNVEADAAGLAMSARWRVWREARLAELYRDLARLAADEEGLRRNAARALARLGAIDRLIAAHRTEGQGG